MVAGLVAACGVVALWLSGSKFGKLLAFVALWPTLCFVVVASPVFAGNEMPAYVGAALIAWAVAALPSVIFRLRQFVPVGRQFPLDTAPHIAVTQLIRDR